MRLRPRALLPVLVVVLAGLALNGCRRVQNPMPSDLKRSGFLLNYTIENPEPAGERVEPPAPKRFEKGRLTVLARHDFLTPGVLNSYMRSSGVTIDKRFYDDNAELHRRIAGGEEVDLIITTGFMVQILKQEGHLAPLDFDHIPNARRVAPEFRALPYDPQDKYSVALTWSTFGIAYNSKIFDHEHIPRSWKDVFEPALDEHPKLAGKVALLSAPHRLFAAAMIRIGNSPNSRDRAEEEAAAAYLRKVAGQTRFVFLQQDVVDRALETEQVLLAMAQSADVTRAAAKNPDVAFVMPVEGTWVSVDTIAIPLPETPQQKEIAEDFLNFLLHPTVAAEISNTTMRASTQNAARPFLSPALKHGPSYLRPNGDWEPLLADAAEKIQEDVFREIAPGRTTVEALTPATK